MEEVEERTTDQPTDEGEEQSLRDHAAESASGVEVGGRTDDQEGSESEIELLGQERFDALKDDPAALRKELNRAATRKFQEIASQRKQLEPYIGFIQALDQDPRAAIMAVGKKLGLQFKEEGEATREEIAEQAGDKITEQVRKHLGPEYEDLADRLAPAIRQVAEEVAKSIATPIVQQQQDIIRDSALRESKAVIDAFTKNNPGWQKYEKAMVELSQKLPPGEGMTETEYMDILYTLATRDAAEGDAARRVASRIESNARSTEGRRSSVPSSRVADAPLKPPTFREAYLAAKEGRRLE